MSEQKAELNSYEKINIDVEQFKKFNNFAKNIDETIQKEVGTGKNEVMQGTGKNEVMQKISSALSSTAAQTIIKEMFDKFVQANSGESFVDFVNEKYITTLVDNIKSNSKNTNKEVEDLLKFSINVDQELNDNSKTDQELNNNILNITTNKLIWLTESNVSSDSVFNKIVFNKIVFNKIVFDNILAAHASVIAKNIINKENYDKNLLKYINPKEGDVSDKYSSYIGSAKTLVQTDITKYINGKLSLAASSNPTNIMEKFIINTNANTDKDKDSKDIANNYVAYKLLTSTENESVSFDKIFNDKTSILSIFSDINNKDIKTYADNANRILDDILNSSTIDGANSKLELLNSRLLNDIKITNVDDNANVKIDGLMKFAVMHSVFAKYDNATNKHHSYDELKKQILDGVLKGVKVDQSINDIKSIVKADIFYKFFNKANNGDANAVAEFNKITTTHKNQYEVFIKNENDSIIKTIDEDFGKIVKIVNDASMQTSTKKYDSFIMKANSNDSIMKHYNTYKLLNYNGTSDVISEITIIDIFKDVHKEEIQKYVTQNSNLFKQVLNKLVSDTSFTTEYNYSNKYLINQNESSASTSLMMSPAINFNKSTQSTIIKGIAYELDGLPNSAFMKFAVMDDLLNELKTDIKKAYVDYDALKKSVLTSFSLGKSDDVDENINKELSPYIINKQIIKCIEGLYSHDADDTKIKTNINNLKYLLPQDKDGLLINKMYDDAATKLRTAEQNAGTSSKVVTSHNDTYNIEIIKYIYGVLGEAKKYQSNPNDKNTEALEQSITTKYQIAKSYSIINDIDALDFENDGKDLAQKLQKYTDDINKSLTSINDSMEIGKITEQLESLKQKYNEEIDPLLDGFAGSITERKQLLINKSLGDKLINPEQVNDAINQERIEKKQESEEYTKNDSIKKMVLDAAKLQLIDNVTKHKEVNAYNDVASINKILSNKVNFVTTLSILDFVTKLRGDDSHQKLRSDLTAIEKSIGKFYLIQCDAEKAKSNASTHKASCDKDELQNYLNISLKQQSDSFVSNFFKQYDISEHKVIDKKIAHIIFSNNTEEYYNIEYTKDGGLAGGRLLNVVIKGDFHKDIANHKNSEYFMVNDKGVYKYINNNNWSHYDGDNVYENTQKFSTEELLTNAIILRQDVGQGSVDQDGVKYNQFNTTHNSGDMNHNTTISNNSSSGGDSDGSIPLIIGGFMAAALAFLMGGGL